jgi:hypothetical protein
MAAFRLIYNNNKSYSEQRAQTENICCERGWGDNGGNYEEELLRIILFHLLSL